MVRGDLGHIVMVVVIDLDQFGAVVVIMIVIMIVIMVEPVLRPMLVVVILLLFLGSAGSIRLVAVAATIAVTVAAVAPRALFLGFGFLEILAHQGFAVGDRDAVIVRMDFTEGQETVAIAAIFNEGSLQRGFDPGYLGEIDIAFERVPAGDLDVEFFKPAAVHHRNAGFFRVGGVDQHN
ncbi:hypothetical protein, partial [Rhizorhabdus sp.]|uniref:hypothetical protein n=1 Tax=Rhizorhabdus sp. TaxID=1968843 RepID=UPI0035B07601